MTDTAPQPKRPGLKQRDLTKCLKCGQGVMHDRNLFFFKVRVERFGANLPAIQRQHGLEMFMGSAASLAQVMGPDEDMALPVPETFAEGLVCDPCALETSVFDLQPGDE